ncbi:MAG: hypothetical protein ACPL07_04175, partial [Candidatus Bathyarchaeia archaeon]
MTAEESNGMRGEGENDELRYEIRLRNLMLLTGKDRGELEKEIEQAGAQYPRSSPAKLVALIGAQHYHVSREALDTPSDRIFVLRSTEKTA